jgi:hypothetical protein
MSRAARKVAEMQREQNDKIVDDAWLEKEEVHSQQQHGLPN